MQEFKLPKVFNWQTASDKLVKKYVADLFQTGTDAPVATELFNNTDVAFTYEYLSAGVYGISCSKPIFTGCGMGCPTGQKTQVTISNNIYWDIISSGVIFNYNIFPVANNYMILITFSTNTGASGDDILGAYVQNAIEVTIYP